MREKINKEFIDVAMMLKKRNKGAKTQDSDEEEGVINSGFDSLHSNLQSFAKHKAFKKQEEVK